MIIYHHKSKLILIIKTVAEGRGDDHFCLFYSLTLTTTSKSNILFILRTKYTQQKELKYRFYLIIWWLRPKEFFLHCKDKVRALHFGFCRTKARSTAWERNMLIFLVQRSHHLSSFSHRLGKVRQGSCSCVDGIMKTTACQEF